MSEKCLANQLQKNKKSQSSQVKSSLFVNFAAERPNSHVKYVKNEMSI